MKTARQLAFDFQPGLTTQFRSLRQVCAAAVYSSRKGLTGVSGDMDMAPSDLCRRLGDDSDRPLTDAHVDQIIASTNDFRPIYYLIEKYLQDPETKRQQAIEQLATAMPGIHALLEQAGVKVRAK